MIELLTTEGEEVYIRKHEIGFIEICLKNKTFSTSTFIEVTPFCDIKLFLQEVLNNDMNSFYTFGDRTGNIRLRTIKANKQKDIIVFYVYNQSNDANVVLFKINTADLKKQIDLYDEYTKAYKQ